MATGGTPFDDSAEELHNWSVTNGSLVDRLNNMVRNGQKQKTLCFISSLGWDASQHFCLYYIATTLNFSFNLLSACCFVNISYYVVTLTAY